MRRNYLRRRLTTESGGDVRRANVMKLINETFETDINEKTDINIVVESYKRQ